MTSEIDSRLCHALCRWSLANKVAEVIFFEDTWAEVDCSNYEFFDSFLVLEIENASNKGEKNTNLKTFKIFESFPQNWQLRILNEKAKPVEAGDTYTKIVKTGERSFERWVGYDLDSSGQMKYPKLFCEFNLDDSVSMFR